MLVLVVLVLILVVMAVVLVVLVVVLAVLVLVVVVLVLVLDLAGQKRLHWKPYIHHFSILTLAMQEEPSSTLLEAITSRLEKQNVVLKSSQSEFLHMQK